MCRHHRTDPKHGEKVPQIRAAFASATLRVASCLNLQLGSKSSALCKCSIRLSKPFWRLDLPEGTCRKAPADLRLPMLPRTSACEVPERQQHPSQFTAHDDHRKFVRLLLAWKCSSRKAQTLTPVTIRMLLDAASILACFSPSEPWSNSLQDPCERALRLYITAVLTMKRDSLFGVRR